MAAMSSTLGLLFVVWLVAVAITSLIASAAWCLLQRRIAGWHPDRRATVALAVASAPTVVPALLLLLLLGPGLAGLVVPHADHCQGHPDHVHLCLVHPAAVLAPAASGLLLALAGAWIAAAGIRLWAAWRANHALGRLARSAKAGALAGADVVDSPHPFALTYGLGRARILVSTSLVRALKPEQIDVVLAHEGEHVRRRDPLRKLVAHLFSVALLPPIRRALLSELALCSEQACDEHAARRGGDRLCVAETILAVERLAGGSPTPTLAGSSIGGSSVPCRVQRLLGEAPPPGTARWRAPLVGLVVLLLLATGRVHHEVEHAIAWMLGSP